MGLEIWTLSQLLEREMRMRNYENKREMQMRDYENNKEEDED